MGEGLYYANEERSEKAEKHFSERGRKRETEKKRRRRQNKERDGGMRERDRQMGRIKEAKGRHRM